MKRLIVASHNKGKIKEYEFMLNHLQDMGVNVNSSLYKLFLVSDIDSGIIFPDENGITYEENALIKAENAYNDLKNNNLLMDDDIVFGDDTGLEVKEMPNELGLFTARFLGEDVLQSERNKEVVKRLNDGNKDRTAKFICTIAYITNGIKKIVRGEVEGSISTDVDEGENGFGYDPIFIPKLYNKPFSSCTTFEKTKISHRGKAFCKMMQELAKK